MIFWLTIMPAIYLLASLQVVGVDWGEWHLTPGYLCVLGGCFMLYSQRLMLVGCIGMLDALLSGLPMGVGLIWAGLLGGLFSVQSSISNGNSSNVTLRLLLIQLITAVLLRQGLWLSYELYLNQLSLSLNQRLWQTGLTLLIPCWFYLTITGLVVILFPSNRRDT